MYGTKDAESLYIVDDVRWLDLEKTSVHGQEWSTAMVKEGGDTSAK